MKPLHQVAVEITATHWAIQADERKRQKQELDHFKVLHNAGLVDRLPRSADGRSIMDLLDEDICGYCGHTKKRGEWCNNSRCDSQLRRKR